MNTRTSAPSQSGDHGDLEMTDQSKKERKPSKVMEMLKLQIKSTPYKATVVRIGSNFGRTLTLGLSCLLALSLVVIGIVFGSVDIIDFEFGVDIETCTAQNVNESVAQYVGKYRNITEWDYLHSLGNDSVDLTDTLYAMANTTYRPGKELLGQSNESDVTWPQIKASGEVDLYKLIQQSMQTCTPTPVPVCWDDWGLSILCVNFGNYPCVPEIEIDENNVPMVYYGGDDPDYSPVNVTKYSAEDFEDTLTAEMLEMLKRVNWIGSIYCFYTAAMVLLGPPYVLTSYKLPTKIQFLLGTLSKPWFVLVILTLSYVAGMAEYAYIQLFEELGVMQLVEFAMKDPCFMNGDFMVALYEQTNQICADIQNSRHLLDSSKDNIAYYVSVEDTYQDLYWDDEADRLFTNTTLEDAGLVWINATECLMDTMLDAIGPTSSIDLFNVLLITGAIASLLLQPVLANYVVSIFIAIDPLCVHCGRIVIPFKHQEHVSGPRYSLVENEAWDQFKKECEERDLLKDIKGFERKKNWLPLLFWTLTLIAIYVIIKQTEAAIKEE